MQSLLICIIVFIWMQSVVIGTRLLETPEDISNYIFSHFGITERAKHVSDLNRKCNKWFVDKHKEEISNVNKLKGWFATKEYTNHLDEIGEMCPKLRMSEYFYMYLPEMLSHLQEHWMSDMIKDQEITQTLYEMKLFPLSLPEFNSDTSSLSDALRLLLLSSRALINYYVPNQCANTFLGELEYQPYSNGIAPFNYWANFIWLRPDSSIFRSDPNDAPIAYFTDFWPIYFSYLYEFYFSSLDQPHLKLRPSSVFHLEGLAKSNLLRLINEFHFIPWTSSSLKQIRNDFHACDVHEMYADFVRLDMSLHYIDKRTPGSDRYTFRTYLVIRSLEDHHCSIPEEFNAQIAFKWDLVQLCYWNWNTHRQAQYDKLVQILSGFVFHIDPFITAFVASYQGNHTNIARDLFGSDLMYNLWESNGLNMDDYEEGFKQLVINGVINRSRYYWCVNNIQNAAKEEISKLANDERLFDANALNLLIAGTKDTVHVEKEFLIESLLLLLDLRADWDVNQTKVMILTANETWF